MPTVPEGRGAVGHAVRRDLSPDADAQCVRSATCVTSSSGSARRPQALPDGVVVLDARSANRLGQSACARAARPRPRARSRRSRSSISCASRNSCATSKRAISRRRSSCRRVATPGRRLALQLVPFAADQKLLMSRDVTELEAVARMRRDFIANVSHELKTPLTVISGFVETLQDIDVDERQRKRFLQLMQEQAQEHAAAGRRPADAVGARERAEPVARRARSPSCRCCSRCRPTRKGCRTARTRSRSTSARRRRFAAAATSSRARSAISSATRSATRRSSGTITLAWRVDADGTGVFAVTDTGIGIAAEHMPRLTERFYRVDRSRSRATGGTGLGLAIVKHVLLRHQAELEIDSERGKGSTFAVRLPARRVDRRRRAERRARRADATRLPTAPPRTRSLPVAHRRAEQALQSRRAPTSIGAFLITRYCGSAPVASASTCASFEAERGKAVRHVASPASAR